MVGSADAPVVGWCFGVKADGNVEPKHDMHGEMTGMVRGLLQTLLRWSADDIKNILSMVRTYESTGAKFGIDPKEVEEKVRGACQRLKERRDQGRPRPGLDDKILCGWNGLMVSPLLGVSASVSLIRSAVGAGQSCPIITIFLSGSLPSSGCRNACSHLHTDQDVGRRQPHALQELARRSRSNWPNGRLRFPHSRATGPVRSERRRGLCAVRGRAAKTARRAVLGRGGRRLFCKCARRARLDPHEGCSGESISLAPLTTAQLTRARTRPSLPPCRSRLTTTPDCPCFAQTTTKRTKSGQRRLTSASGRNCSRFQGRLATVCAD